MQNILIAKTKLPVDFIQNLYTEFNKNVADRILEGMSNNRLTTIRVNTLKYNINDLKEYLDNNKITYELVDWYKDALVIKNVKEKELENLEIYKNGQIYIQSLSSMIPALALKPKENDKVLDLTAAPGSKTTQMACMMNNKGYILANEIDKIRCQRLEYNVKMQNAEIVDVINEDGKNIHKKYQEYFDKVLLDTPCSGEGRFLTQNPKTYNSWSKDEVSRLEKLQKELIKSGIIALKSGGIMCYSTCTLNKVENENIIKWAKDNFNIELLDIDLKIKNSIKVMKKSLKILPNEMQEGFFIAKFRKK